MAGLLVGILLFFCFSLIFSALSFAPWLPSRERDLKRIGELAALRPGQIFYDLGAGDGRVAIYAAKNLKVKARGVEMALPFYLICRLRQLFNRGADLEFKFNNLYKENLASADAVYFFSLPASLNEKFFAKLRRELKPGVKIISYAFKLDGWRPAAVSRPTEKDLPIYLYVA